ncbi:MAG: hypothetical protein WC198_09400 [Victivallaceae bacterium]
MKYGLLKIRLLFFTGSFLFFGIISGCEDNYISSIPNYPVSLELNLTASYPTFKDNPYQFLVFEKPRYDYEYLGYGGILVVCGFGSDRPYEYYAYDLACPHEADAKIKVTPNSNGQAVCNTCGSVYDIVNGFGIPIDDSPAREPLKRYKTYLDSKPTGDYLYITRK